MIREPQEDFDTEDIYFDHDVHGRTFRIAVSRNVIDDKLGRETTREERVQFVTRNRQIIAHNVAGRIPRTGDDTGMRITEEQLKGCYSK